MKLVKLFVELRYIEAHRLFRVYDEFYKAFMEKEPPLRQPALLPGFGLSVKDKKLRISVDAQRSVVDAEYIPNRGYCLDIMTQSFRKVNALESLPRLRRMGCRSYWIAASQSSFDEFVSLHRQIFFKDNALLQRSVDVGTALVFDLEKGCSANVSFGPMKGEELQGRLVSSKEGLPPVLTFVDVDYYVVASQGLDYSERNLHDFVGEAWDFAERQSNEIETIVSQGLVK